MELVPYGRTVLEEGASDSFACVRAHDVLTAMAVEGDAVF
jgi:hypothetical protein